MTACRQDALGRLQQAHLDPSVLPYIYIYIKLPCASASLFADDAAEILFREGV